MGKSATNLQRKHTYRETHVYTTITHDVPVVTTSTWTIRVAPQSFSMHKPNKGWRHRMGEGRGEGRERSERGYQKQGHEDEDEDEDEDEKLVPAKKECR
jgi:hypothetical protein